MQRLLLLIAITLALRPGQAPLQWPPERPNDAAAVAQPAFRITRQSTMAAVGAASRAKAARQRSTQANGQPARPVEDVELTKVKPRHTGADGSFRSSKRPRSLPHQTRTSLAPDNAHATELRIHSARRGAPPTPAVSVTRRPPKLRAGIASRLRSAAKPLHAADGAAAAERADRSGAPRRAAAHPAVATLERRSAKRQQTGAGEPEVAYTTKRFHIPDDGAAAAAGPPAANGPSPAPTFAMRSSPHGSKPVALPSAAAAGVVPASRSVPKAGGRPQLSMRQALCAANACDKKLGPFEAYELELQPPVFSSALRGRRVLMAGVGEQTPSNFQLTPSTLLGSPTV